MVSPFQLKLGLKPRVHSGIDLPRTTRLSSRTGIAGNPVNDHAALCITGIITDLENECWFTYDGVVEGIGRAGGNLGELIGTTDGKLIDAGKERVILLSLYVALKLKLSLPEPIFTSGVRLRSISTP